MLDSMLADMRFGLRQFIKTPMITAAVVLSLAVGIGANTAVFTLLDAAILKPLPVPNADRLRVIEWSNADGFPSFIDNIRGSSGRNAPEGGIASSSVSAPIHRALAREASSFAAVVGIADANEVSAAFGTASAEPVDLQYVSANFFQGLGLSPVLGRAFVPDEDRAGEAPVVVVSHRYWRNRLGGVPDALGRTVRVNDIDARIVGVAPPEFFGVNVGEWTDLYAPLAARAVLDRSGGEQTENAASWWVQQLAVLSPDVSESAALTELNGLFRNQVAAIAGADAEASLPVLSAYPGRQGIEEANDEIRTALWLLMLLVGLLLLIVCANVANLLLARSEGRIRESAVRLTLGATPGRIFRQQLIESSMLALAGGAIGVLLGFMLSTFIHNLFQTGNDASELFALQLDSRVVGYGIAISMASALLFGVSPAFRAARAYLRTNLSAHARSISVATLRGPKLLVSAQIALCLGALVAAGLLGRSLQGLASIDLGFDPEGLVYATVNPGLSDFPADRVEGYLDEVQGSLEAIPGVMSVSRIEMRPLEGRGRFSFANIPGNPPVESFDPRFMINVNNVGPEVFETLRIPLRAGRTLDPARNGVVVDQRFAQRFFGGEGALGRRFSTGGGDAEEYEIVGIAQDAISIALRNEPRPMVYVPHDPAAAGSAVSFAIRTERDPQLLLETIRNVVAAENPSVPLTELHTQTALLDRMLRTERMLAFLSAGFGLLATALAAIGLAGLLAYAVARRTSEIGLRMALGAAPRRMVAMVMKDSLKLIGTGLVVGIPCAFGIAKLLESSLYQLAPADPVTMIVSILGLLAISLAAALLPARRAARAAPSAALRAE